MCTDVRPLLAMRADDLIIEPDELCSTCWMKAVLEKVMSTARVCCSSKLHCGRYQYSLTEEELDYLQSGVAVQDFQNIRVRCRV